MRKYTWYDDGGKMPDYVAQFLIKQKKWVQEQVKQNPSDLYWQQVNLVQQQYDGLIAGYNQFADKHENISETEMHVLTSFGDMFELRNIKKSKRPNYNEMTAFEIENYFVENTHCSALIKVSEDLKDLYFGHTSWFTFSSMTRIYKEYSFNFKNALTKAKTVTFSSYPANLGSNDDFYITSGGLGVIETSNNIFNTDLFDLIKPESLLCWQRVVLANRMSSTAPEWTKIFSTHNSGTYNNQYMILDYKKFLPGKPLPSDLLWIAEQIPGRVETSDVTPILSFGYWPSYNIPFSQTIRNISGYDEILRKKPELEDMLSYETCVRANIFRRNHTKVTSLDTLQSMLRYNNYQFDPLSKSNPGYAISSRNDLKGTGSCSGGYDSKASNYYFAMSSLGAVAINGPTYDQVPAFSWNDQCSPNDRYEHDGLPTTWKFGWYPFSSLFYKGE